MANYANWTAYLALYPAGVSQVDFEKYLPEACSRIDILTAGRAKSAENWMLEQLCAAACAAVNAIAQREAMRGLGGVPLQWVKNERYEERYADDAGDVAVERAIVENLRGTGLCGAL